MFDRISEITLIFVRMISDIFAFLCNLRCCIFISLRKLIVRKGFQLINIFFFQTQLCKHCFDNLSSVPVLCIAEKIRIYYAAFNNALMKQTIRFRHL